MIGRVEIFPAIVGHSSVTENPAYAGKQGLVFAPEGDGLSIGLLPGDGTIAAVHLDADELDLLAGRLAEILVDGIRQAQASASTPRLRVVGGTDV